MENLQLAKQIRRTIEANKGILPQELKNEIDDELAELLNNIDYSINQQEGVILARTEHEVVL
jgi:hypothetical protein